MRYSRVTPGWIYREITAQTRRTAFSLIELLIAMSVFLIVASYAIRTVQDSRHMWNEGESLGEVYAGAEQTFELLRRDLATAVADAALPPFILELAEASGESIGTNLFSDLAFLRFKPIHNAQSATRALEAVTYWVRLATNDYSRYQLMRDAFSSTNGLFYQDGAWPEVQLFANAEVVADNVAFFACLTDRGRVGYDISHTTASDRLPRWLDIHIELLSEEDARDISELLLLGNLDIEKELNRRATAFSKRIYPGASHAR